MLLAMPSDDPPPACESEEPPLLALPHELQLQLLRQLDGRSLARYAECTSKEFSHVCAPEMRELWAALHRSEVLSAPVLPSSPVLDEHPAFLLPRKPLHSDETVEGKDASECSTHANPTDVYVLCAQRLTCCASTLRAFAESAFVRGSSALQRRCPRCGKQHRFASEPLDDHGRRQRHLCDYFFGAPPARRTPQPPAPAAGATQAIDVS